MKKKELFKQLGQVRKLEIELEQYIEKFKMEYIPFSTSSSHQDVFYWEIERNFDYARSHYYDTIDGLLEKFYDSLSEFEESEKEIAELYAKADNIRSNVDNLFYQYSNGYRNCAEIYENVVRTTYRVWAILRAAAREDPEVGAVIREQEAREEADAEYAAEVYGGLLSSKD